MYMAFVPTRSLPASRRRRGNYALLTLGYILFVPLGSLAAMS